MALEHWCQPKFVAWFKEWNYKTFEPIFGRAAITLGIGPPHSSYVLFSLTFEKEKDLNLFYVFVRRRLLLRKTHSSLLTESA